jgi:hypothetical protein
MECRTEDVSEFSDEELDELIKNVPSLAQYQSPKIRSLIKNPFIAKIATQVNVNPESEQDIVTAFQNAVWQQIIGKDHEKVNGINDKRRKLFIDIAVRRIKSLRYMVSAEDLDSDVLAQLEIDGLVSFNESRDSVTPAHDVLEDWALEAFIEKQFSQNSSAASFLLTIGSDRGIQREFRFWLPKILIFNYPRALEFICESLETSEISDSWKDEVIVAILCSKNSQLIFPSIKNALLNNGSTLFSRMCLLLKCACKVYESYTRKLCMR